MSVLTLALTLPLPTADALGKIVIFLLMLSILVVLHEAGHFLVARRNGVRVNDFAVGFGPTLLKWTSPRSGTNYRINLLPIGGYCAMKGEDGQTNEAEQQREFRASTRATDDNFQSKSPRQRLSIVVAGPIANFILAFAILVMAAVSFGIASDREFTTKIGPLSPGSPGARAGLQVGDDVVAIDGIATTTGDAMVNKIRSSPGKPLRVTYRRHGISTDVTIVPKPVHEGNKTIGQFGFIRIPEFRRVSPLRAVPIAATEFLGMVQMQLTGYGQLIGHPAQYGSQVSGVIGMERAASVYQDLGWAPYLQLAAMISVALGLLNLLPFRRSMAAAPFSFWLRCYAGGRSNLKKKRSYTLPDSRFSWY